MMRDAINVARIGFQRVYKSSMMLLLLIQSRISFQTKKVLTQQIKVIIIANKTILKFQNTS